MAKFHARMRIVLQPLVRKAWRQYEKQEGDRKKLARTVNYFLWCLCTDEVVPVYDGVGSIEPFVTAEAMAFYANGMRIRLLPHVRAAVEKLLWKYPACRLSDLINHDLLHYLRGLGYVQVHGNTYALTSYQERHAWDLEVEAAMKGSEQG